MPDGHKDYSATPLWKKLGIRGDSRIVLVGAPPGFEGRLEPLPEGAAVLHRATSELDVAVLFVTLRKDLDQHFAKLAAMMCPDGRLWIAWPKKAAKVATDVDFDVVQGTGLGAGLVDNKTAAIDEVYQGLQFVMRLKDRPRGRSR